MMPSEGGALAFGDLVLVAFPFTDQSSTKRRPAVVISTAAYNESRPDVILMPVTSQFRQDARAHHVVLGEWRSAGLLKPSAVKPVIATFERSLVLRTLGSLAARDLAALKTALADLIG